MKIHEVRLFKPTLAKPVIWVLILLFLVAGNTLAHNKVVIIPLDGSESSVACNIGETNCGGGFCTSLLSDTQNCGTCGNVCSNSCSSGVCVSGETCVDGILNQDETDVDCGGSCPNKCVVGQSCIVNSDCQSGTCDLNTCQ